MLLKPIKNPLNTTQSVGGLGPLSGPLWAVCDALVTRHDVLGQRAARHDHFRAATPRPRSPILPSAVNWVALEAPDKESLNAPIHGHGEAGRVRVGDCEVRSAAQSVEGVCKGARSNESMRRHGAC